MRRRSGQSTRRLTFAGVAASLVAMTVATGCGGDTCVVINTAVTRTDWTVTFAVTDSTVVGDLELNVGVEPCTGNCDCHETCGCGDSCDCFAHFASERSELDCEPAVDASFRGTLDENGTAHIALVADDAILAPGEILKCDYSSATEPSPSDFRVVVEAATGLSAKHSSRLPTVVVTGISRR